MISSRTELCAKVATLILAGAVLLGALAPAAFAQGDQAVNVVTIGVLVDQSGLRASMDRGIEAALRVAAAEINESFARTGEPLRVELRVGDTRSDPDHALLQLQALAQEGIRIVIGPTTSAEVHRVRSYAQTQGILLISPSSTAPSLSLSGDLTYRMAPDDTMQGKALADRMWRDGIRAVVPIRRSDLYSQDLVDSTKRVFESRNLIIDLDLEDTKDANDNCKGLREEDLKKKDPPIQVCAGVVYNPRTSDYISEVQALTDVVAGAVQAYGARRVAVLLIAFDEAVSILEQASKSPILSLVRWYGADGIAKSSSIVNQPDAGRFAASVSFTASLFAEPQNQAFARLSEATLREYGIAPDAYAANAYDALWLVARAMTAERAGGDPRRIAASLASAARGYEGASGQVRFNAAGDRDLDQYDFWQVQRRGAAYDWVRVR